MSRNVCVEEVAHIVTGGPRRILRVAVFTAAMLLSASCARTTVVQADPIVFVAVAPLDALHDAPLDACRVWSRSCGRLKSCMAIRLPAP